MTFKNIKIPSMVEEAIYVCLCIDSEWEHNIGRITVSTHNYSNPKWSSDEKHVLLTKKKLKIKIPKVTIDFKGELVDKLEKQKEDELARHHMQMKEFQDKIDNLLAIEYKPEKAA